MASAQKNFWLVLMDYYSKWITTEAYASIRGMAIVGPLPMAPTQKRFWLVLMDYYSKWITTEAYASIKDKDVQMFVCKHIIF